MLRKALDRLKANLRTGDVTEECIESSPIEREAGNVSECVVTETKIHPGHVVLAVEKTRSTPVRYAVRKIQHEHNAYVIKVLLADGKCWLTGMCSGIDAKGWMKRVFPDAELVTWTFLAGEKVETRFISHDELETLCTGTSNQSAR